MDCVEKKLIAHHALTGSYFDTNPQNYVKLLALRSGRQTLWRALPSAETCTPRPRVAMWLRWQREHDTASLTEHLRARVHVPFS